MSAHASSRSSDRWRPLQITLIVLAVLIALGVLLWSIFGYGVHPEYAYKPPLDKVANAPRHAAPTYDVWGESVTAREASELLQTEEGREFLSASQGAVLIDEELLEQGRDAFYEETFGNETFMTDVVGILDGPLDVDRLVAAIAALGGEGTNNLQVKLGHTVTIAGQTFEEGQLIDTGLDVPRGAASPLGMQVTFEDGRLRVGATCALCHATVHPETMEVIEGAPNNNLNIGLLLALAPNSAALFPNAEIESLSDYVVDPERTVINAAGEPEALPDPAALEDAVDAIFLSWPPGQFDSTIDLSANPSKFPNAFTLGDHPYGWNGFALAGPFRGVSMLTNNVHALNADATMHVEGMPLIAGIDKEVYIATLLQNAADERFRYDPASGQRPTEFFDSVNPTDSPSFSHAVALPTYPRSTFISPNGLWVSLPGRPVWYDVNAIAAFQNTLRPPPAPIDRDPELAELGRTVFERAQCNDCHSGPFLTQNRLIPLDEIGTEPKRAPSMEDMEDALDDPIAYPFDTSVPIPDHAVGIPVPLDDDDLELLQMGWMLGGREGGYKIPSLVGLYWSAPYLHDGGVAVGPDPETQVGLPGTLLRAIPPDPIASLRALVDRSWRQRVVEANLASERLQRISAPGVGHEYWVDEEAGFSHEDQDALIHYLMTLEAPQVLPE